ncbi:hypothetical protein [Gilvimarinus algae]|uniref:Uncharacterized protein n=1 Tax=Gilvimarinus algae TaxID=3058037 RepID=A0ABT8TIG8_9GAMM|nr:hypothetical protein [Gilvimarinus sp. SDUM040014]MDO3383380.1 hypothetical protein [Gilvimarinus sp. SDUM040014]
MQYSKPMIDLVLELRRRVPSTLKPGIKLANPDVLAELADHYHDGANTVTRALIKELMQLAGEPWVARLDSPEPAPSPKSQVKVYRGQVSLKEVPPAKSSDDEHSSRPARIYRGQVVYR